METTAKSRSTLKKATGAQKDARTIKRLNQIKKILILLLLLFILVAVVQFIAGQFERPKTYYEYQLQTWNQILAKRPNDVQARTRIAQLHIKMGQTGRAVGELKEVLKDDPKNISAFYYLAVAYQKQGLSDQAEKQLLKSLSLANNDKVKVLPAFRLASIYRDNGKTDKAIEYYELAARGEPLLWNSHYELGRLYEKKSDPAKALIHYEQAVRFNPTQKLKSAIAGIKAKLSR